MLLLNALQLNHTVNQIIRLQVIVHKAGHEDKLKDLRDDNGQAGKVGANKAVRSV